MTGRADHPNLTARPALPPEWVWIVLLGAGMAMGGCLAGLVALTRVVLPYDETFVGLSRAELAAVSNRLLLFLTHDRVTLAGSMISIGVLYSQLALYPLRLGERWARRVVTLSASVGFASFLLYLGFGYLDPLHAIVTALLLSFFLLSLRARTSPTSPARDRIAVADWRRVRWGQLLLVATGAGLMAGGVALAWIGVTNVFVPEDLQFMQLARVDLDAASARLVPLIAHDRAALGGVLFANGLGVLLTSLWGYRSGARWLWWTMLCSGVPGFVGTLAIHASVGYTDPGHLAPALAGAGLYAAGLIASFRALCRATAT
jgi:dihydroorotate dehydrogenase